MAVPEKIQFPNRTMKIMFLFSFGKIPLSLFLCLGFWGLSENFVSSLSKEQKIISVVVKSTFLWILFRDIILWSAIFPSNSQNPETEIDRIHRGSPPIFNHISRYHLLGFERIIRRETRTEMEINWGKAGKSYQIATEYKRKLLAFGNPLHCLKIASFLPAESIKTSLR